MKSTLLVHEGNRRLYAVVWAADSGQCVLCHTGIEGEEKVIVHQRGGMEHANPNVCLSRRPPKTDKNPTADFLGYLGD